MSNPTRRTVLKSAAWSVPVIAVAVSVPLAAASTAPEPADRPISCTLINGTGRPTYNVGYLSGRSEILFRSQITTHEDSWLKAACPAPSKNNEGKTVTR